MISLSGSNLRILKTPLGVSILAHLVVLLIFALIVIKPNRESNWHDFEWLSQLTEAIPRISETSTEEKSDKEQSAPSKASTTDQNAPTMESSPSPAPSAVQPHREIIEAPGELADPSPSNSPKVISNLGSRGNVNRSGMLQGNCPGGSSSRLEGKGIRSKKEVLPALKVSDYGEVRLSFKVSQTGLVQPNSITVVKSASNAQNQSAIEALRQWEFVVSPGNPEDQTYSILFIFNPVN